VRRECCLQCWHCHAWWLRGVLPSNYNLISFPFPLTPSFFIFVHSSTSLWRRVTWKKRKNLLKLLYATASTSSHKKY
jgi:hypothetical protein